MARDAMSGDWWLEYAFELWNFFETYVSYDVLYMTIDIVQL